MEPYFKMIIEHKDIGLNILMQVIQYLYAGWFSCIRVDLEWSLKILTNISLCGIFMEQLLPPHIDLLIDSYFPLTVPFSFVPPFRRPAAALRPARKTHVTCHFQKSWNSGRPARKTHVTCHFQKSW
jgi:hypothetical protein